MRDLVFRLDREADKLIDSLDKHPIARTLFAGTIAADHYAEYLEQTHHYVGVAHELLRASGERLLTMHRHPLLARLLIEKSEEEAGHDAWARDDRAALGFGAASSGPNVAVQAYIFGHRFEAETGSGAAFLGTAYVLEALSARRASSTVRNLLLRSRIPGIEGAVTFLRAHGEADHGHIARLATILRGFTAPEDSEAILRSARRTRLYFPGFFSSPR
ncbi:iron-containing redox enzyme family protein [Sorangium atrum]|uniref:Heme oxygenase n=1 Tax=Sorangium atrum TaxID=2995308 RepID=A0ABT5BVU3_9BACT|nr:iron-containing redox enzyme family protein [Sorangium aterium]MDC0678286.1 heme oxygenase [Sorangium aterium]